jgi:hypothetical protein
LAVSSELELQLHEHFIESSEQTAVAVPEEHVTVHSLPELVLQLAASTSPRLVAKKTNIKPIITIFLNTLNSSTV